LTLTKGNTSYDYSTLGHLSTEIGKGLAPHGLSASWKIDQDDKIKVTCIITHEMGHSESTSLSATADTTGSKNAIQSVGSTITYLQKYTLLSLTGLAAMGQDDDGHGASTKPIEKITEEQAVTLNALASEVNADFNGFCKYFKVEDIDDLPASHYGRAVKMLEKKRGK
jgi:hypothetical protein